MSPKNTGARRKIDELLSGAMAQLNDPTGERVVAKVLEHWPPAHEIRNPSGYLLERARDAAQWASSPEARSPAPASTLSVPSPTTYGVALAGEVLAGRQSAEEARFNCDFAFTTTSERLLAVEALDAVLDGAHHASQTSDAVA